MGNPLNRNACCPYGLGLPAVSGLLSNLHSEPHACTAVLKGIEEAKAKGFKPHEVQEKARKLANEHLKVPETSAVAIQYNTVLVSKRK